LAEWVERTTYRKRKMALEDWAIILFVICLDAFRVEKIGGINLQGHFNDKSHFGKLGFKTFLIHFEALNDLFWGQNFPIPSWDPLIMIYTQITLQWHKNLVNQSLYVKVIPLASFPTMLTTKVREDATSSPVTHSYGAIHVWTFKNIIEAPKNYHNGGLRK
jgi:hypothetical protein